MKFPYGFDWNIRRHVSDVKTLWKKKICRADPVGWILCNSETIITIVLRFFFFFFPFVNISLLIENGSFEYLFFFFSPVSRRTTAAARRDYCDSTRNDTGRGRTSRELIAPGGGGGVVLYLSFIPTNKLHRSPCVFIYPINPITSLSRYREYRP